MSASILVTGGAGFIGSHLVEALLRRGDRIVVLDDLNSFYDPALKRRNLDEMRRTGGFELVEGDIRDGRRVGELCRRHGFDVIVHLAAMAGVRPSIQDPVTYASVNVEGTAQLLQAAAEHRIPRFIFAGSSSVYGNNEKVPFHEDDPVDRPISPYAATKRAGELLGATWHQVHGLDFCSLRFFTAYGPRQRPEMAIHAFTRAIDAGVPIAVYGNGSSRRDYTYIDDIVDGIIRAIDRSRGYRIYNLGESKTTGLLELVGEIERALGRKAVIEHRPMQPGDVKETWADVGRAREELGYAPRVPVPEGLARFVTWFRRGAR